MITIIYPVNVKLEGVVGRASRDEKANSCDRILASAARLFRERGIEGASVNDVMADAGLTHGGFYRHFASKEALLVGALDAAFQQIVASLEADLTDQPPDLVGQRFRDFYLSDGHVENAGIGCPAAALASEVARGSAATRSAFATGVRTMLSAIGQTKSGDDSAREIAAARELAMLIGALAIARAGDQKLADVMLAACRREVEASA